MENFLLFELLSFELHPMPDEIQNTKKYTSNGKKNLSCKWMFFPILTFDIIEEIASGNRI